MNIRLYYFALFFIAFGMISYTVTVGSKHISYGQEIAQLERSKHQLLERQHQLNQQIAQEQSLSVLEKVAAEEGYVAIKDVVRVQGSTVASR